jgi:hypothetical protein
MNGTAPEDGIGATKEILKSDKMSIKESATRIAAKGGHQIARPIDQTKADPIPRVETGVACHSRSVDAIGGFRKGESNLRGGILVVRLKYPRGALLRREGGDEIPQEGKKMIHGP